MLFTTDSMANNKIILVTHPIPLMVENEYQGRFIEFTRKLFDGEKVMLEFVILPTNRAIDFFRQRQALIFFPGNSAYDLGDHLQTQIFYDKRDFAFHRANDKIENLQDLRGKVVGLTLGYPYDDKILKYPGVTFEIAPSDESNFRKLASKRIDAFIVEELTGLKALKMIGLKNITYHQKKPLSSIPVYYALRNSAEGKKWREILNKKLSQQKANIENLKQSY